MPKKKTAIGDVGGDERIAYGENSKATGETSVAVGPDAAKTGGVISLAPTYGVVVAGERIYSAADVVAMGRGGLIEVEDKNGNRVTVTRSYYDRWPSVRENFRPVAESPGITPTETPTGDENKEN